jgi:alpha-tubulin suppressor-like RCC1 family protein
VLCWGANDHGQLGRRLAERSRAEPVEVPNLTRASALALGTKHTCAALGGSFVCWGANDHFSLGSRTL